MRKDMNTKLSDIQSNLNNLNNKVDHISNSCEELKAENDHLNNKTRGEVSKMDPDTMKPVKVGQKTTHTDLSDDESYTST
ncbi:hypothetical protein ACF0H5_012212 [Mactra antiquata]